jgi:hypothetical protein
MVVFCLSDCDRAGHQMPVSIGRKLQGLRDLLLPSLQFEVRPVAVTVEQVAALGLPSSPLKDTERRAGCWRAAYGVEQNEIDPIATLQPQILARILREAIAPFYDATLDGRVARARAEWREQAQQRRTEQIDGAAPERIKAHAEARLSELQAEIEAINGELRLAIDDDFELPPIEIPEPSVDPTLHGKPLVSWAWSWSDQTHALKDRKGYLTDGGTP